MSKLTTPNKRVAKPTGSTLGKKKQLSLMSFFKVAPSSSPLRNKDKDSGKESDKENDIMDNSMLTDTPLSSETGIDTKKVPSLPVKEPKTKAALEEVDRNVPASSPIKAIEKASKGRKQVSYAESDSEDDAPVVRKRRKVVDSDSEDDFKPEGEPSEDDMSDFVVEDASEPEPEEEDEDEEEDAPKPARKKKGVENSKSPSQKAPSNLGKKFEAGLSYTSQAPPKKSTPVKSTKPKSNFAKENEERYQWLVDVRDAEKRPVDHPEYDGRTLYIPSSAWAKFTAFEKQYWEIKGKMWDTVVFFKKGKFYELYENDAMIANTQFDLKIAGGGRANMKLAGIPEMSFEYWAKEFISSGYKVAKVDQKESLLAKEMRGGGTKEEKIIKRELTAVLTGGTLTDLNMISDDMSIYCMAIKEQENDDGTKTFGVAFVDTATLELNMIELHDDAECTKLDTLITQIKPKEVICEKNNLCLGAVKLIKFSAHLGHQIWNTLNPYSEFWDVDTTNEHLAAAQYFTTEPAVLTKFKNLPVAYNAFGGLLYYLTSLKLDTSVMTLGNFQEYDISKHLAGHMLVDGVTLTNLEILTNSTGHDEGTLFKLVNRAVTPFGKRVLKNWVLHPLMSAKDIDARLDSVEYLMNENPDFRMALEALLSGMPDLERLLARIHSKTLKFKEFLRVVESFERIAKGVKELQTFRGPVGVIARNIEAFPDIGDLLSEWTDAFDRELAASDVVAPSSGVDQEFDDSQAELGRLEEALNEHLREYKKTYKSHEICFKDSGKEIYLIEVPVKVKNIPKDWQQMGATSKVKRYWSPEVRVLARQLMEQRETHRVVCENLRFRMYERFDVHYSTWLRVVKAVGSIDCVLALTKTSETLGYPACRPQFVEGGQGLIEMRELRHPCFMGTRDFIPNDVLLGGEHANFGLLTGANAAGKSTLMRTTAMAVILAQLGCYVPAASARLNPIDKIMTRLGANDNIMQGKSTFFVELSESKKILANATTKSLVILDELGRGGSLSDGYAIAESVLHHIATHVQPLGFFATHYGTLGHAFTSHPQIRPMRMGIIADDNSRNITFLYKLEPGSAPGSFGMSVASMCGIARDIVDNAEVAAKRYEQTSKMKREAKPQDLALGLQSDFAALVNGYDLGQDILRYSAEVRRSALTNILQSI